MMELRKIRGRVVPYWTHRRSPLVWPGHRAALTAALRDHPCYRDAVVSDWVVTPRGNLVGRLHRSGEPNELVAKVHLHAADQGDTQKSFAALQVLATLPAPPRVEVPRPVDLLTVAIRDRRYLVSLETVVADGNHREAGSESEARLIKVWEEMASTWSAPDRLSHATLSARVNEFFGAIPPERSPSQKLRDAISRACDTLQAGDHVLYRGVEHGDLAPGNLLLTDTGRAGVIDWVDLRVDGLPDLDLVHLILYHHARCEGSGFVPQWLRLLDGDPPASLQERYGTVREVSALAVAYWVQFICRSVGHSNSAWRELHLWRLAGLIEEKWR